MYEPIGIDKEGNEIHLLDIIESGGPDAVETCALKENIARLYDLMGSVLTVQEQTVLKLRYGLLGEKRIHAESHRRTAGHQPLLRIPHRKKRCPKAAQKLLHAAEYQNVP